MTAGVAYAFTITRDGIDALDAEAASGLVITFSFAATSILLSLVGVGSLFAWFLDSNLRSYDAYRLALAIVPLFMAVGWARIVSLSRGSRSR